MGLARASAGAIIFSLPLLMTMEMWWLGFYLDPLMLVQFSIVNFAVLVGLSRVSGFEETDSRIEDVLDAFAAYAVAVIAAAVVLYLFGVIRPDMPTSEIVGKIVVQAVPASFGAMIASKQLGEQKETAARERWRATFVGQLFLMLAGALFLSFNLAPTEEMILIAFRMTEVNAIGLILLSILLLHAFVYSVGFAGQEARGGNGTAAVFFRFTLPGYAIALLASLYILWTFGRIDGADPSLVAMKVAVLAFPAAIGAAIARIVV